MITIDLPIKNPKKPPKLTFPDRCVNCRKPKEKTMPVKLNTGAQAKGGQMAQLEFDVPLCRDCAAKENKIGNVTWIPFFLVGLVVCAIVFVPVWLVTPEGPTLQTQEFPYVVGASAGILAGVVVGSLVEFGLKLLLTPVYGKLLRNRPLTVFSVFTDSEDLIGISTRFVNGRKNLKITFENDDTARDFISLNPQENS